MKDDEQQGKVEEINDLVDRAAARFSPGTASRVDPDRDRRIVRMFPWFVATCLLIWAAGILWIGEYTFSKMIEVLCLVFVSCFAIIGVPCAAVMDRGVFNGWVILAGSFAMTVVLWVSGNLMGQMYYTEAVSAMLGSVGMFLDSAWERVLGFLATYAILLFTSIGVLSVINAYMRVYVGDVFLAMQSRAGTGRRGKAERFFKVPEIIDVEEVRMEPRRTEHVFDLWTASQVSAYMFILGLLISSYIFLNPLLTEVLEWDTMLAVTLMLSMFMPALVLPWMIVRGVGAKVVSSAPRDYYLWTGARKRLFSTFMALGVFMLMLVLSVYLGSSLWDIARSYVTFLIPLFVTSVTYGSLYANNFDRGTCATIVESFENGKPKG